jgi:formate C-acetyltransferase
MSGNPLRRAGGSAYRGWKGLPAAPARGLGDLRADGFRAVLQPTRTPMIALDAPPRALDALPTSDAWRGFAPGSWEDRIDVRDFIQRNYNPYEGDAGFLAPATARTEALWTKLGGLFEEERRRGVLDVSQVPSSITAHAPGYIDRENELIVGLQTEAPLKRAIFPNGGYRMVEASLEAYGFEATRTSRRSSRSTARPTTRASSTCTRRRSWRPAAPASSPASPTPTAAAASSATTAASRSTAWTGSSRTRRRPSASARRGPLHRRGDPRPRGTRRADPRPPRAEGDGRQLRLRHLRPAGNAHEAVQWLYFAYLAAVKEQNGAAMSLGRTSTFLDVYFERDLAEGTITEAGRRSSSTTS